MVGVGRTVNLSSAGALVASQQPIRVGARIELFVDWPIRPSGTTLQLFAVGNVVRSDAGVFALSFRRCEFRTARKQPEPVKKEGHREVG